MAANSLCGVLAGEALAKYGFPAGHPFSLDRFAAFAQRFTRSGLDKHERVQLNEPQLAHDDDILLFHTHQYLQQVKTQSITGQGYLDNGDTPAFPGVYEAAATVVGSSLAAADFIMSGQVETAFVPIAGLHHARRDMAAGFCVFNDCGAVIEYLRKRRGLKQIAYVDIDAHHGDGVFYAFESEADVICLDLHEDGRYLYPGTGDVSESGKGSAKGTKCNIPMPMYSDDEIFMEKFAEGMRFLKSFQPEFILFQCGADSLRGDPITHLMYSEKAHAHAAVELLMFARQLGHGRVLGLGGGGYNLGNLARAWCAVIEAWVNA